MGHITASRILAGAMRECAAELADPQARRLIEAIADAHDLAAERMDNYERARSGRAQGDQGAG
jgi:hypothetical protein